MARVTDRQITRAARTAGIPEWLFRAVIGQESGGRTGAVSPAGARGPAQLMPGTAAALEGRYRGLNTKTAYGNLLGGAYYLREQKDRFKRWDLALSAYNSGPAGSESSGKVEGFSETTAYVRNILAKAAELKKQYGGRSQPGSTSTGATIPGVPTLIPGRPEKLGPDPFTAKQAAMEGLAALARGQYSPSEGLAALQKAREAAPPVLSPATDPEVVTGAPVASGAKFVRGADPGKWVIVPKPAGQWPGPGEEILSFTAGIAKRSGRPITAWDTSTHSKMTVNGNVSAHTTGDALDLPFSGRRLIRMGRIALMQAGMSRREAMKQKGGLYNVGGYQIIFNTQTGGDHTDHLHVAIRR